MTETSESAIDCGSGEETVTAGFLNSVLENFTEVMDMQPLSKAWPKLVGNEGDPLRYS